MLPSSFLISIISLAILLDCCLFCLAEPETNLAPYSVHFTWISGSDRSNAVGVYPQKGTSTADSTPGARTSFAMAMNQTSDQVVLHGGYGLGDVGGNKYLDDIWRFDVKTNRWAWIYGNSSLGSPSSNGQLVPAARKGHSMVLDPNANVIFIFGGMSIGLELSKLNDLWRWDPVTSVWTWINVGITKPKPRIQQSLVLHQSKNRLILFGGCNDARIWNDLWAYDTVKSSWSLIRGQTEPGATGSYGNLGEEGWLNDPSARCGHSMVFHSDLNRFYLFGGFIGGSNDQAISELWRFNPETNYWSWLSGSPQSELYSYGNAGISKSTNVPPGRYGHSMVVDPKSGALILFGGKGSYRSVSGIGTGPLNDLWIWQPSNSMWTWIAGDSTASQPGIYGNKSVESENNLIGARDSHSMVIDSTGNLLIFGGFVESTEMNDLWRVSIRLQCRVGQYQNGWLCSSCPSGSYLDLESICAPCPTDSICNETSFECPPTHRLSNNGTACTFISKRQTDNMSNWWIDNPIYAGILLFFIVAFMFQIGFAAGFLSDLFCVDFDSMINMTYRTTSTVSTMNSMSTACTLTEASTLTVATETSKPSTILPTSSNRNISESSALTS